MRIHEEMMIQNKAGRGMNAKARRALQVTTEDEKDESPQVYKNRIMVHDIHRVRELSALLEERRRYFDGQLGEVYRNAGVSGSGSNNALPRLRGMDSPPVSATASESNVTGMSLMGSTDMSHNVESTDVHSACSGRSYSVFADDECSVADSFEFSENKARIGGRSWNSSSMLAGSTAGRGTHGKKSRFAGFSKDTIHNEVMRTADLEKKLKARRSSLPLALEASLKKPLKKKVFVKTSKGLRKEKGRAGSAAASAEDNLSAIASTLLTKDNGYPDSSSSDDEMTAKLRHFSSKAEEAKNGEYFSMTDMLKETRKFDISQDLKAHTSSDFALRIPGKQRPDRRISWDTEIMGVAPRLKAKQVLATTKSSASKSASSPLAPMIEYSPRSSLSTLSGSYPKIAFSSLEKIYREEGDKSKFQLHPSSLLLKPVPKIDMNLFAEQTHSEPDYSHDFRYLSLLDALVPCFEPAKAWRPAKTKKSEDNFFSGANSPYRFQRDTGSNFGEDSEEEFGTEDSDEEPEEDEEESDGCTTQALIDHVESSFLMLLDETVEKVEKSQDIHRAATNSINSTRKISSQQFPAQAAKLSRDEETQTDTSFSPEHVISHTIGEANDVRHEIASLRLARDTLVNQRKDVADRIKKGTSKDHRLDEKKVYEYEEAIEAIDSVIEFKNEIICGRECILSNYFAPGRTEADLVTRLSNLTTLDLQRLLWKYFLKVVELRYSSKRLEKQIDELETQYERLNTNLNRSNKYMKDMRSEYESRIKMFIGLYSKDANSAMAQYVSHLESELQKASKRQNDLEKSVFELLVRHGYLTNTQDCDVKQVLKKLDIDANQVGLNGKPESKSKRKADQGGELASNLRQAVEYGITNQSRRMKEAYDNRHRNHQPSHSSHNHHHHRHHHHHHGQAHGNRDTGTFDAHDFHHAPLQPAEVKRTNKKLIIQPRPNTPDQ